MGHVYSILRVLASVLLGVMVFVGFLSYLILNNFSEKLLNPEFYKTTISAENTYNRIHSDVLADLGLFTKTTSLLGNIKAITSQDATTLLQELIPPAYIQKQIEESIDQTITYINNDKQVLEVYIDLNEPLNGVKPVMFAFIDEKIDKLRLETPGIVECSETGVGYLITRYVNEFESLSNGEIPVAIPSLNILEPACRQLLFDSSYELLVGSASLTPETIQVLRENRVRLRAPFLSGETRDMLKVASRIFSEPFMDQGIDAFRKDLVTGNRMDMIHQLDEWYPNLTESQIRNDLADLKDFISLVSTFGILTSLIVVIGGTALMVLVFLPYLSNMLRWPGLTLLITGSFCLLAAKIAEHEVPNRLAFLINSRSTQVSDIPPSIIDLGGEILLLFGTRLTYGLANPSLTLLIVGGILFGTSFFTKLFNQLIPFFK